jgi:tetratricopeptide (TPR) repeat protein
MAIQPSSIVARQALANSFSALHRFQETIDEWQELLRLNPQLEHADLVHLAIANNFERVGNAAAALGEYRQALEINPQLEAARGRIAALASQSGEPTP